MTPVIHFFPECGVQARQLGRALGWECAEIAVHHFPDGESLVRVTKSGSTAFVYRSLDAPNAKLVELLLAASALRDAGAGRVVLVAPYLGYMRQDRAFRPGEAISQKVIGGLVARHFDGLVTADPHLHRTPTLAAVVPGITSATASAARVIANAIGQRMQPGTLLVGPDSESREWVESVAAPLGLEFMTGVKERTGDRAVSIVLPDAGKAAGRPAILVDDLISSGESLIACAARLREAGASSVAAVTTHCLANDADLARLAQAGISPVLATDSVPGPVARIPIAPALADAIRESGISKA